PAHFLLAQTYTRKNNLDLAIRKTEDTKALSPFDVGVAFQLGFLYYQAGTFDKAQAEFERAVSLNANYSNARYFLGLIYDRQGNKASALDQFQKIAALNPDNQEVKKIIQNLQSGHPALFGVVPPAPAPEKRGTAPVGETKGNVVTPK
ncbi:tetratricopeptide repeat protein, partial [Patescibacteria group bacterium]|nr:tetratricopeptide repeat protein [Patescibacteria group bacterium]